MSKPLSENALKVINAVRTKRSTSGGRLLSSHAKVVRRLVSPSKPPARVTGASMISARMTARNSSSVAMMSSLDVVGASR